MHSVKSTIDFKAQIATLARHEGIWDGTYRYYDATGRQGELIRGWAADVALDEFARTSMLYWVRRNEPGVYVYEMIQLSDCGRYRARVWQWFREGRLERRTLIDEEKVSDDWATFPA